MALACSAPEPTSQPVPQTATVYRIASVEGDLEHLLADDGSTLVFDRANKKLAGKHAKTVWGEWSETLQVCLGDPLDLPPGGDPEGFRKLRWDGKGGSWMLELGGMNRCAMSGRIHLAAKRNRVDVAELSVDGVLWGDGGGEVAKSLLRAELRERAVEAWPELPPEEQMSTWRALSADPDAEDERAEIERLYGPVKSASKAAPSSKVRP